MTRLLKSLLGFALGCAAAAGAFMIVGNEAFIVPPVIGLLAWLSTEAAAMKPATE